MESCNENALYRFLQVALAALACLASLYALSAMRPETVRRLLHLQGNSADFINTIRIIHRMEDPSVPDGSVIFLGDSITMGLATAAVAANTVNYGIGYQRSDQLLEFLNNYRSINRAERVYLMIGTNDVLQGTEGDLELRYRQILARIQPPVVMSSIPPIRATIWDSHKIEPAAVQSAVQAAERACKADLGCTFLNVNAALAKDDAAFLKDGVHLSPEGYSVWIKLMKKPARS